MNDEERLRNALNVAAMFGIVDDDNGKTVPIEMTENWGINTHDQTVLFTDDLIPTHIVYDGDEEVYRGGYQQVLDWLKNHRLGLVESQIHIAPIETEVELKTEGATPTASDFVIFEDEDEDEDE